MHLTTEQTPQSPPAGIIVMTCDGRHAEVVYDVPSVRDAIGRVPKRGVNTFFVSQDGGASWGRYVRAGGHGGWKCTGPVRLAEAVQG